MPWLNSACPKMWESMFHLSFYCFWGRRYQRQVCSQPKYLKLLERHYDVTTHYRHFNMHVLYIIRKLGVQAIQRCTTLHSYHYCKHMNGIDMICFPKINQFFTIIRVLRHNGWKLGWKWCHNWIPGILKCRKVCFVCCSLTFRSGVIYVNIFEFMSSKTWLWRHYDVITRNSYSSQRAIMRDWKAEISSFQKMYDSLCPFYW